VGPTEASLAGLVALGVAVPGYRARPVTVLKIWCPVQVLLALVLAVTSWNEAGPLTALPLAGAAVAYVILFSTILGAGDVTATRRLATIAGVLFLGGLALLTREIGMNGTGLAILGIPAAIVILIPWLGE
jgi:hypothetical protein